MRLRHFLFLILPLTALLLPALFHDVLAANEYNIRGLASSSYGYISFNCLDDGFAGKFPFTFELHFNVPACSLDHGVNLGWDNNFTGQAWNPLLGFIDFGTSATPPDNYAFNTNCENDCNASNSCSACYNSSNERVFGWGQVVSTGEWIELNSDITPQVTINNYLSSAPGVFNGYGYASSSLGAIMFNCAEDNSCSTFDHKVYLWKLELQEMSAPNWSFNDACTSGAKKAVFKWLRRSGTQTAYRVIVNTSNSTSTPLFDSGKLTGSASQLICPGPSCDFTPAYNTSYYWWLQLWDYNDEPTDFFQFDTDTYGVLTDNIAANSADSPDPNFTFTNYKHEFPTPYFTWSPLEILVGTSTDFVSNSHFYTTANPDSSAQLCVDGNCDFLWEVSDGAAIISDATHATTSINFVNNNPKTVSLRITDFDQYTCSTSSPVLTINYQLPIWKEVKAE